MAVAFRHLADDGLQPQGHADLLRRRRRGGRRRLGRRVDGRPPLGRGRRRLRAHRARRLVDGRPRRHPPRHRQRRREGTRLAPPAGARARRATARCRSAPTTRWSRRPRSCAGWRRTDPAAQIDDLWRGQVDADGPARRGAGRAPDPTRIWTTPRHACRRAGGPDRATPARTRRSRPNVVHGGQKTNIDPRRRRHRRRHPHGARHDRATTSTAMLADALGDLAARVEVEPPPGVDADPSRPPATRCGTRWRRAPRSPTPAPS